MHLSFLNNIVMAFVMVIGLFAPTNANAIVRNIDFFANTFLSGEEGFELLGTTDPDQYSSIVGEFSFDTELTTSVASSETSTPLSGFAAFTNSDAFSYGIEGAGSISIRSSSAGSFEFFEVFGPGIRIGDFFVSLVMQVLFLTDEFKTDSFDINPAGIESVLFIIIEDLSGKEQAAITYADINFVEAPSTPSPTPPSPAVVPLPAALPLFGTGLAIMGFVGWRRKLKINEAA